MTVHRLSSALLVIVVAIAARATLAFWDAPFTPHHPDEGILSREAIALWEGVTPREVGWPASTTRLMLSAVHGVQMLITTGPTLWQQRSHPQDALNTIVLWIAHRSADSDPLFRAGRALCIFIGVLQVATCWWAGVRWLGARGASIAAVTCAVAPIAVTHSQYVLSDVSGLLFATAAMGLLPGANVARVYGASALVACAAASKFHFGLWMLPVLGLAWFGRPGTRPQSLGRVATALALFAIVLLAFVPWFWLNPLLAWKEFAGVVGVKVGSGVPIGVVLSHVFVLFAGLGVLAWALPIIRPLALWRVRRIEGSLVTATATLGLVVLATSQVVFDRYALVLLPGIALMAGAAGVSILDTLKARSIALKWVLGSAVCAAIVFQIAIAERLAAEPNVDWDVQQWLLTHARPGARIAIHDEFTQYIPRTAQQLMECQEYVTTRSAYAEKWSINASAVPQGSGDPFRRAVLNDELFAAYWCGREQLLNRNGYYVVSYHDGARFRTLRQTVLLREFREGSRDSMPGFDLLVTSFPVPGAAAPVAVFSRRAGRRLIYDMAGLR